MKYSLNILLIVLISFSVSSFATAQEKSGNKELSGKSSKTVIKAKKQEKTLKKVNENKANLDKSVLVKQSKNEKNEIKTNSNNNELVNSEIWVQEKENIADYDNVPASNSINNEPIEIENTPSANKPFQIIGFILLFLGLIIIIMIWSNYSVNTKKRNNLSEENKIMNLSNFEILDKLDLENGKNIYLIRLLNRKFLIGISWNGISLLSDLSDLELPTSENNSMASAGQKAGISSSDNNLDFMTLQNYAYEKKVLNNEFDPEPNDLDKNKKNIESQNMLSHSGLTRNTAETSSNTELKSSKTISNRSNKSIIKDETKTPLNNTDFSKQTTLRKSHLSDKASESINKFKRPAWLEEREAQKKVIPSSVQDSSSLNFPINNSLNTNNNTTNTVKQAQAEINSIIALMPSKLNDIPEILPELKQEKEKNKLVEVEEKPELKEEIKFERKTTSNISTVSRKISLVEE